MRRPSEEAEALIAAWSPASSRTVTAGAMGGGGDAGGSGGSAGGVGGGEGGLHRPHVPWSAHATGTCFDRDDALVHVYVHAWV